MQLRKRDAQLLCSFLYNSPFLNHPPRTSSGTWKMSIHSQSSTENDSSSRSSENDPPRHPPAQDPLSPRTQKPLFQRRKWANRLGKIFDDICKAESFYLDSAVYGYLSINCEKFVIANDGNYGSQPQPCFFTPLPRQELDSHSIDLDVSDEITGDIRDELKVSSEILIELADKGLEPLNSALFPGYHLSWRFVECPRENFREKGKTLTSLTPWRPR